MFLNKNLHYSLISVFSSICTTPVISLMCLFLQKFNGNIDRNSVVTQVLSPPIVARYIQIHAIEYNINLVGMRLELHGCPGN